MKITGIRVFCKIELVLKLWWFIHKIDLLTSSKLKRRRPNGTKIAGNGGCNRKILWVKQSCCVIQLSGNGSIPTRLKIGNDPNDIILECRFVYFTLTTCTTFDYSVNMQ